MFFKTLRRTSKSSSQSATTITTTNPHTQNIGITRVTSGSSSLHNGTISSAQPSCFKTPAIHVSAPAVTPLSTVGEYGNTNKEKQGRKSEVEENDAADEGRDYREFLEKARREDEETEKERARQVQKARETNMSPWARLI